MTGDVAAQTTVVIPVWDDYAGAPLLEALESLHSQEVPTRIVIIDNASGVAMPPAPGVEVIRSPERLALGAARNLGLERAHTPYVLVWDADDMMLPGTLAVLERHIASDPGMAAFATAIVEGSGARHRWPRRWVGPLTRVPALFSLVHCVWSLYPTTGATIMRTELVRAGGGYSDAESGDDWVAGVSLAFRGRVGWSERPGRVYRRHRASVWARHSTPSYLLAHARTVRERVRSDPGIPRWAKVALPVIRVGQYLAISAHVAVEAARRLRRTT